MSFKDVEWWVCCAFIIVISYTLGTLTGIPTWSATDTKLSAISETVTSVAGIATLAAAYYAFKSFSSWRERLIDQHQFEQSALALKEMKKSYELVGFHLFDFIMISVDVNSCKKILDESQAKKNKAIIEFYQNEYSDKIAKLGDITNKFRESGANYDSCYTSFKAMRGVNKVNVFTFQNVMDFYKKITNDDKKETKLIQEDLIEIANFTTQGSNLIDELFKELYQIN